MPSLELRPAKLTKIKDSDECVLLIEAAPNDATRILRIGFGNEQTIPRGVDDRSFNDIELLREAG
jgi:hypothetical protein